MHALKWWNLHTRMFFAPDDGGGAAAPSSPPSGGDGSGSVPAPAPASEASPSPAPDSGAPAPAPSTPEANPWENLGSFDDLDHIEIPPTPQVVPPVAPVVPPVATPPAAQVAPQVTPPAEPAPTTPATPDTAPVAQLSPSDPAGIANAIETNRDAVIAHLATTKFALSEAELADLESDVSVAVPKLLAKVFMESQVSMQKFLAQAVPGMVKNYQTVTTANNEAEGKFFEAHKALGLDKSNPQHRQVASRIASIYRQNNPRIPLDQLIQEVGPMVAMSLRLNAPPVTPQAAPGAPRGGTGFRPAVNGGGGAPPTPVEENQWAGLGQTYD